MPARVTLILVVLLVSPAEARVPLYSRTVIMTRTINVDDSAAHARAVVNRIEPGDAFRWFRPFWVRPRRKGPGRLEARIPGATCAVRVKARPRPGGARVTEVATVRGLPLWTAVCALFHRSMTSLDKAYRRSNQRDRAFPPGRR